MTRSELPVDPNKFLEIAATCVCFNLRRGARAVTQFYDKLFEAHGLRATQFSLLGALVIAEAMGQPATISLLAEALVMDRSTLARNLKPLARDGLVTIAAGEDRRTRVVKLTGEGRQRLAQVVRLWDEGQAHFLAQLGEVQVGALLQGISEAVAAAREG